MANFLFALFKTGTSSTLALCINIFCTKIIALILGPYGIGLFSLVRQVVGVFTSIAMGGQTALSQGIASKHDGEKQVYIGSVFWIFVIYCVMSFSAIHVIQLIVLKSTFGVEVASFAKISQFIFVPIILSIAYIFFKGLLIGFQAIGSLALLEVLGPLTTAILVYPVCIFIESGYESSFIWMISLAQISMLIPIYFLAKSRGWIIFSQNRFLSLIDLGAAKHFFKVAGGLVIAGLVGSGALLLIRMMVVLTSGIDGAGFFDLAWALSANYVMILLGSFGSYYLPALSKPKVIHENVDLVHMALKLSIVIMAPMIVGVIILKSLLVQLMYTDAFIPALDLVRWMLIGDYLKITSWILAIPALANQDMKTYVWTEIIWYFGFLLFSAISLLYFNEIQGVGIAFTVLYLGLAIYYLKYTEKKYQFRVHKALKIYWLIGFFLVLGASFLTWNDEVINMSYIAIWLIMSISFIWLIMRNSIKRKVTNYFSSKGLN